MAGFILLLIVIQRKRQIKHLEKINEIQSKFEKSMLNSQLEMQEQTFLHISREIHDNISLSLTLAKLNLYTLDLDNKDKIKLKLDNSVDLITQSLAQLRDLSKSLDSDLIQKNGLLTAVDEEIKKLKKVEQFQIQYNINGMPVYMNSGPELIIFRIIQEAFNNIIKHAKAQTICLLLNYNHSYLLIKIEDDGIGFDTASLSDNRISGLKNMKARTGLLGGTMTLQTGVGKGTILRFTIPLNAHGK